MIFYWNIFIDFVEALPEVPESTQEAEEGVKYATIDWEDSSELNYMKYRIVAEPLDSSVCLNMLYSFSKYFIFCSMKFLPGKLTHSPENSNFKN